MSEKQNFSVCASCVLFVLIIKFHICGDFFPVHFAFYTTVEYEVCWGVCITNKQHNLASELPHPEKLRCPFPYCPWITTAFAFCHWTGCERLLFLWRVQPVVLLLTAFSSRPVGWFSQLATGKCQLTMRRDSARQNKLHLVAVDSEPYGNGFAVFSV